MKRSLLTIAACGLLAALLLGEVSAGEPPSLCPATGARVFVSEIGSIFLNGTHVESQRLRQLLHGISPKPEIICYSRETPEGRPPPSTEAVLDAIHSMNLPVTVRVQDEITEEMRATLENCEDSQRTMNSCAVYRYRQADWELHTLFERQLSRLKDADLAESFRTAQSAWWRYMEADCMYQVGPGKGAGSIWTLWQYSCLTKHTNQRIDSIKEFLACTDNGCPGQ